MFKLAAIIALATVMSGAQASVITVGSNASWTKSSITTTGGTGTWSNPTLAPPSAATFTNAVVVGGGVAAPAAAALGVTGISTGSGVTYFSTMFNLNPFSSISAAIALAVDNGAAVWINGQFVGAETSLDTANWTSQYPSFDIASTGLIQNINKFDQTQAFTGFTAGQNSLIVAVRNLDGNDTGGFAFRMNLNVTEAATANVPEPGSLALMALALAGFGVARSRKSR